MERLLAFAPLGLGLLSPDFRYVWVNPALASMNGVALEDHVGRTVQDIRPDLAETLQPLLHGILATGSPVSDFVIGRHPPHPQDEPPQWSGNLRLLRSSDGEVLGIGMVIEPQRSEWNDRSKAASGAREELDRQRYGFIETLAHELKNPLTPILSAAQMLQRYGAKKPDVVDWAGASIERQARQMTAGVNDLLDLARAALGKLELRPSKLDLKPLLTRAIETCRESADRSDPTLSLALSSRELRVLGDAARLGQVFQHLLRNAVDFTPPGGRIALAAAIEDGEVVIRVSDTGAGLDPGMLEAIFEPFFKADDSDLRKARGMGVGLALARRLIALHGGTLRAFSQGLGHGAEFVARLPAILPPPSDSDGQGSRTPADA